MKFLLLIITIFSLSFHSISSDIVDVSIVQLLAKGATDGLRFLPSEDAVMGRVVELFEFRK